jgi:hypothetical protein
VPTDVLDAINICISIFFCCKIDVAGRPEGKRPLGRPRRRWEDNIKMDLGEIWIDGANWIRLAQGRVQWRAFVNTVMNLPQVK